MKHAVQLSLICNSTTDDNFAIFDAEIDVETLEGSVCLLLFKCRHNGIGDLAISTERRQGSTGGQRGNRHAQKESSHGNPPTVFLREKTALWSCCLRLQHYKRSLSDRL